MFDMLKKLINNAYAPYSNFKVSSIVVTKDNNRFSGVNVENASYGASICAERNAINNAVGNGYQKGDFKELHLMLNSAKMGYPCYLCRQTISEFFDNDNDIFLYNKNGLQTKLKVSDIINYSFTSDNL